MTELVDAFTAARGDSAPAFEAGPDSGGAVDAALAGWVTAGAQAWPGVTIAPAAFVAFVTPRLLARAAASSAGELRRTHEVLVLPDLYLACGCLRDSPGAARELERSYFPQLASTLRRRGASRDAADEVLAQLREKLMVGTATEPPLLEKYGGRGDIGSWLKICAIRLLLKHERRQARELALEDDVAEVMDASLSRLPELEPLRARFRARFKELFAVSFAQLRPKDRHVLLQHYADGLTTEQISRLSQVHRVTVSRRLTAARDALLADLQRALVVEFGLRPAECDSLIRAFRSQLEISFAGDEAGG